jgi:hypothetical protein
MSLEINGVYNNYGNFYLNKKEAKPVKDSKVINDTNKANETTKTESVQQSTQDYLQSLKEKYPDVNITVVDFKTEKQERSYMLGSSGYNNVALSRDILEKMAKDPEVAEKYEKAIGNLPNVVKEAKEKIEATPGSKVLAMGMEIDKEGKISYWCVSCSVTEVPTSDRKEKFKEQLEEKRLAMKEKEKAEEKRKEKIKEQEVLEQKRAEKRKEEQERLEILISEGKTADELVSNMIDGTAGVVSEGMFNSVETGIHLNFKV